MLAPRPARCLQLPEIVGYKIFPVTFPGDSYVSDQLGSRAIYFTYGYTYLEPAYMTNRDSVQRGLNYLFWLKMI